MDVRGKTVFRSSVGSDYSGYMEDADLRRHLAEVADITCEIIREDINESDHRSAAIRTHAPEEHT
jgi:hypothetical protein